MWKHQLKKNKGSKMSLKNKLKYLIKNKQINKSYQIINLIKLTQKNLIVIQMMMFQLKNNSNLTKAIMKNPKKK